MNTPGIKTGETLSCGFEPGLQVVLIECSQAAGHEGLAWHDMDHNPETGRQDVLSKRQKVVSRAALSGSQQSVSR